MSKRFLHSNIIRFCVLLLISSFFIPSAFSSEIKAKSVLAIFAHPDDEVVASPILAKYARQGSKVHLAIVTDGQKGVQAHAQIPAGEELATARAKEAQCSSEQLGIEPVILLNYIDGTLGEHKNFGPLHKDIEELFVKLKPEIVITWGPGGGYGHIDHRMVSNITTEVFQKGGGEDWPKQLYYTGFPHSMIKDLPNVKSDLVQFMKHNFHTLKDEYLPIHINYSKKDSEKAIKAINCHRSQFSPVVMKEFPMLLNPDGRSISYLRTWN